jgi:endonuclease-3
VKDIYATGFYNSKAKNIKAAAKILIDKYNGRVPDGINELTELPGVGRKTANVVRSHVFGIPSVTVDTHVGRISRRLGLTENEDPVKVEFDLMDAFPKDCWIKCNMQMITHGRLVCKARNPLCGKCFLNGMCDYYIKGTKK